VGNTEYPKIAPDLRVTFRLKAPEAKKVQLRGGAGLVKDSLDLARGDDGVWTVTTPPAVPGFHYYWFVVDGLNVNDASSYSYFGYGRETSGIEVPEKGADFSHDGVFGDADAFNRKVKLFWLCAGPAEEQINKNTAAMHEALDKAGIKNVFYSSPGTDHEWQTWRRSLHEFVPRLFRD
jgi:hypothetical protein